MEIFDKNGRIFGKMNVVDFFILVFIVAVAYGGYTYIFGQPNPTFVTILSENQPSWVYNNIHAGDKELGEFTGRTIGEVVDFKTIPAFGENESVVLVMKLDASNKNGVLFYKDEILRIGKEIEISTNKVYLKGTTISINNAMLENAIVDAPAIIEVLSAGVPVNIAKELYKGLYFEQGGKKVFEITDIQKIGNDYETYNIRMRILLDSKIFNNKLLFGNQLITKNGDFKIDGKDFSMKLFITEILPATEENRNLESIKAEKIVYLEVGDILRELARPLKVGDGEETTDGTKISEILEINREYLGETHLLLKVKARIEVELFNNRIFYKNQAIMPGDTIPIKSKNLNFSGKIKGIYEKLSDIPATQNQKVRVRLLARNLQPWIADKIIAGIEEKDPDNGNIIVELLKKSESGAKIINISQSGQIVESLHPENRDLELEADILAEKDEHGLFFKGNYLKVNSQIRLVFPQVAVDAIVAEISDGKQT